MYYGWIPDFHNKSIDKHIDRPPFICPPTVQNKDSI